MKREGHEVSVARDGEAGAGRRSAPAARPGAARRDDAEEDPASRSAGGARRRGAGRREDPMLTAKGRDTDIAKGLALGADAYMTKPFSTKELAERCAAAGSAAMKIDKLEIMPPPWRRLMRRSRAGRWRWADLRDARWAEREALVAMLRRAWRSSWMVGLPSLAAWWRCGCFREASSSGWPRPPGAGRGRTSPAARRRSPGEGRAFRGQRKDARAGRRAGSTNAASAPSCATTWRPGARGQRAASSRSATNRLAALMAELTQSVVVCNLDGRILLYNNRARTQFRRCRARPASAGGAELIGLGARSTRCSSAPSSPMRWRSSSACARRGPPSAQFVTTHARRPVAARADGAGARDRRRARRGGRGVGLRADAREHHARLRDESERDRCCTASPKAAAPSLGNLQAAVELLELAGHRRRRCASASTA